MENPASPDLPNSADLSYLPCRGEGPPRDECVWYWQLGVCPFSEPTRQIRQQGLPKQLPRAGELHHVLS